MANQKIILLTGASSGIGFQTAQLLAKNGYKVYGAARKVESLTKLQDPNIIGISMDVTSDDSVNAGLKQIIDAEGRIDVLINNAGYGSYGPIEEVPVEEAERQLQVNVIGAMRLVRLVLPYMRSQKSGRIINTSSIGGRVSTYFGGWYHASKFAIEGLSECLRMEVEPFGIEVVVIEPGGIKTDWGFIAADHLKETVKGTPYQAAGDKTADAMIKRYEGNSLSSPDVVAQTMLKAVSSFSPKPRYVCGYMSRTVIVMHALLPTKIYNKIMQNIA